MTWWGVSAAGACPADFILLWGEKSGTNPVSAPSPYNFNPDNILQQLESLYSFYVNSLQFTPEAGLLATYKIDVIVTQTWNRTELNAWATGGSADGKVGMINIAPGAALPGSWGLAHELGHVFQNLTFLGKSGMGFTNASAGTFWETSAAPSDYGYNKIKLVPSSSGALIRLHFKGHVNSAAGSGWSYGFVAVRNGVPRYGPVSTASDGEISFQTQAGENEVYLVVLGAPSAVHHYAFLDGYKRPLAQQRRRLGEQLGQRRLHRVRGSARRGLRQQHGERQRPDRGSRLGQLRRYRGRQRRGEGQRADPGRRQPVRQRRGRRRRRAGDRLRLGHLPAVQPGPRLRRPGRRDRHQPGDLRRRRPRLRRPPLLRPGAPARTARNVSWNGSLGAGAKTAFGFLGGGSPAAATLTCAAN